MKFRGWQFITIICSIAFSISGLSLYLNKSTAKLLTVDDERIDFNSVELDYRESPPQVPPVYVYTPVPKLQDRDFETIFEATKININTASTDELSKIEGIGAKTAQDIVERRPYSSIKQLLNLPRFSEKKWSKIASLITTGTPEHLEIAVETSSDKPTPGDDEVSVSMPEEKNTDKPTKAAVVQGHKINLNTATLQDLETLPRIGPSTAQRIIDFRQTQGKFKRIEDLMEIKGIGSKTFEKFKDSITVEGE